MITEQVIREVDIKVGSRNIINLPYADDAELISDNLSNMKTVMYRVGASSKAAGQNLNVKKTKYKFEWPNNSPQNQDYTLLDVVNIVVWIQGISR